MKKILKAALVLFAAAVAIVSITAVCKYVERKNFYECINGTVDFMNRDYQIVKYDFQSEQEIRTLKYHSSLEACTLNKTSNKIYAVLNHNSVIESRSYAEVIAVDENTVKTMYTLKKSVYSGDFNGDKLYMITRSDRTYDLS